MTLHSPGLRLAISGLIISCTLSVIAGSPDKTPPSPPTNFKTNSLSCSSVALSWSPSADQTNGNEQVSGLQGYKVFRNGTLLQQVTTTSFTDSSVTVSVSYTYGVSAVDVAGNVSGTNTLTVTIPLCPDTTTPNVPAAPSTSALVCNQVNLSWAPVTDKTNLTQTMSGIKGYNVYRDGVLLRLVSTTSMTDNVPAGNTTYSYQLSAVDNANNESSRSVAGTITLPACPDLSAPSVPAGLAIAALDCGRLSLSWSPSTDVVVPNQATTGVKGYNVYRAGVFLIFVSETNTIDAGLTGDTSYSYQISAVDNVNNESALCSAVSFTTPGCPDTTSPTVPSNLSATTSSCNQFSFSWSPSSDQSVPNQLTSGLYGYYVYRDGAFWGFVVSPSATDYSVTEGTPYTYRVSSLDYSFNESAQSAPLSISTPQCRANAASDLKISLIGDKVILQWAGTTGALYQVESMTGFGSPWSPVNSPTTTFACTNLACDRACMFRVALFTNTPVYTANYLVNSTDTNPPAVPAPLVVTAVSASEIDLSWNSVTDVGTANGNQVFTSGLDRYLIFRDGTYLKSTAGDVTNSIDSNVIPGGHYTYSVAAIDKAGNVSAAASDSVNTCIFLQPAGTVAGPEATNGSFVVDATGCSWNVSVPATSGSWIQLQGGTNGYGDGTVNYSIAANPDMTERTGAILVENKTYAITQRGKQCVYSLNPSGFTHSDTAGNGSFSVIVASGCAWNASTGDSWIHTSTSGSGSGTVSYTIDGNNSATSRSGTISVAGQFFNVYQAGAPCAYNLSPNSNAISATAFSSSFSVTASLGCGWSPSVTNNWIHATPGTGIVNYSVDANSSSGSRSGNITIAGQNFTITQAGVGCNYSLSPTNASFSSAAGSGSFSMTANAGCVWSATTTNTWLHTSTSGAGNGTVSYTVDANTSSTPRSGTISAAGKTHVVTQSGATLCSYNLGAPDAAFSSAAATSNVTVTAGTGCSWSVSNAVGWITITAGASGSGNGSVSYSVTANSSTNSRTGTLTIAGQSYTITQNGNQKPIAKAGSDVSVTIGATATFTAAGSSDADGSISTYQWAFGDGYTASGYSVTHAYSTLGIYTVTLTVTDNLGATGIDNAIATILALPDTTPPNANLTSPVNNSTVSNVITMAATATDNAGGSGMARVEFYCDSLSTPLGTDSSTPYTNSFDTRTIGNGTHTFYCRAYDNAGNAINSSVVTVTINNPVDQGPWAKRMGGSGAESGLAVAVDSTGNVYVAGYFQGTVDFGGGLLTSAGGYDVVLAKYSPSGAHIWSKRYGSTGNEMVNSISLDPSGNILLAGSFYGVANFGGSNLTSAGDADAFLAKYTPQGDPIWSQRLGSTYPDVIKNVTTDSQGNIIVTGFLQGNVVIGTTTIISWGLGIDAFIAKFAPDGSNLWAKNFYNAGTEFGNTVAVDKRINPLNGLPYDNIVLVGYFDGYINLAGGQADANLLTTPGGYIAKFTPTGTHLWSKAYGGSNGSTRFWSMAMDSNGDLAVSGDFPLQTDLGGGPINGTSWGTDMFVAKFSGIDGAYRWATLIGGVQASIGRPVSMATDVQNNVFLTGFFQGTFNFGNQSLTSAIGTSDGMIAKYSNSGAPVWAQGYNSSATANGSSIAVDSTGHGVATGYFSGTANCAGQQLTSAGSVDMILVRLNP